MSAALVAFALAYAGLAALGLTLDRHHAQLWPAAKLPSANRRLAWRAVGWSLLLLSAGACVRAWGGATGVAAWFGVLSAGALLLAGLLAAAPCWAGRLAWAAAAVGPTAAAWRLVSA